MAPWEKDQQQFPQHVSVRYVEVMLERGNVHEAVELDATSAPKSLDCCSKTIAYCIHTFCSMYCWPAAIP